MKGTGPHRRLLRRATVVALVSLVPGALVLGPGAFAGLGSSQFTGGLVMIVALAALIGLLTYVRWHAWAVLVAVSYAFGLTQVIGLTAKDAPPGAYDLALVVVLVFTGIGFSIGMVAEFVRFLHYLSHGGRGKAAKNPPDDKAKWDATTTD